MRQTHELMINPTDDSLNRHTQHLMQPNLSTTHSFHTHLRIHHRLPSQHLPNSPLSTDVFPQSVGIESIRGDVRVVGSGIDVWTRVEEHEEVSFEDPAA